MYKVIRWIFRETIMSKIFEGSVIWKWLRNPNVFQCRDLTNRLIGWISGHHTSVNSPKLTLIQRQHIIPVYTLSQCIYYSKFSLYCMILPYRLFVCIKWYSIYLIITFLCIEQWKKTWSRLNVMRDLSI